LAHAFVVDEISARIDIPFFKIIIGNFVMQTGMDQQELNLCTFILFAARDNSIWWCAKIFEAIDLAIYQN
jgi:hypothetical protein